MLSRDSYAITRLAGRQAEIDRHRSGRINSQRRRRRRSSRSRGGGGKRAKSSVYETFCIKLTKALYCFALFHTCNADDPNTVSSPYTL